MFQSFERMGDSGREYYLDQLGRDPQTLRSGSSAYRPCVATIDGVRYPRSLVTGVVNGSLANDRRAMLTIPLRGAFERIRARLGRDDNMHILGPGYCIFEVWGDGRRLFRSDAIRSSLSDVAVDAAFPKRGGTQEVDVPIQGVQQLRLVTRYANEFTQQARYVHRAFGCVWADPRLTPVSEESAARAALEADPGLRAALRNAAVKIAAAAPVTTAGSPPPRVGIAPFPLETRSGDGRFPVGLSEPATREFLSRELFAIKRGGAAAFVALAAGPALRLSTELPADGKQRTDPRAVAAAGKRAGADLLLFGALRPVKDGRPGWTLALMMLDVQTGRTVASAAERLPASDRAGSGGG